MLFFKGFENLDSWLPVIRKSWLIVIFISKRSFEDWEKVSQVRTIRHLLRNSAGQTTSPVILFTKRTHNSIDISTALFKKFHEELTMNVVSIIELLKSFLCSLLLEQTPLLVYERISSRNNCKLGIPKALEEAEIVPSSNKHKKYLKLFQFSIDISEFGFNYNFSVELQF